MTERIDELKSKLPQARKQAITSRQPILLTLAKLCSTEVNNLVPQKMQIGGVWLLPQNELAELIFAPEKMPSNICRQIKAAVAKTPSGDFLLLMTDPWDDVAITGALRHLGSFKASLALVDMELIQGLLDHYDNGQSAASRVSVQGAASTNDGMLRAINLAGIDTATNSVVKFVDAMLFDASRSGASDIHFETTRQGIQAKLRLDGVLVEAGHFSDANRSQEVLSRIKVLASLDIAETRIPQDGRFRVAINQREVDFRVSIMPSTLGEDAVLRLLDKSHLLKGRDSINLETLGFDKNICAEIRRLANEPHGMLLVTGPTGSGKTTTLYAVLSEVNTGKEKIITIEDPVEYELPGILQIPVNEKKGLTFAKGLRSILRHDPDRILVGEIRDSETAEIAIQAALTGHLVFTTVHANNAFDVLGRMIHLDIDLFGFASAVNGVVAQRLLRLNCADCMVSSEISDANWGLLLSEVPGAIKAMLRKGVGCDSCRGTGYKGRTAIAEVLPFNDLLREKISQRAPLTEVKNLASELKITPILRSALELVASGKTNIEEVSRVVSMAPAR